MELILYSFLYFLGITYAIWPNLTSERNLIFLWLGITLLISFVIRSDVAPQVCEYYCDDTASDISSYLTLFTANSISLQYLKEFLFWGLARILYKISQDSHIVFFVLDGICVVLIYLGYRNLRRFFFPQIIKINVIYSLFGFMLFFPVVVGYQASYRQFFSTILLMFLLPIIVRAKWIKSTLIFSLSIFSHNSLIICAPFIVMLRGNKNIKLFFLLLILIPITYYFLTTELKYVYIFSNLEIGKNISHLCLIVILTICFIGITYRNPRSNTLFNHFLFSVALTFIIIWLTFKSEAILRFFYLFLTLLFPIMAFYIEDKFSNLIIPRILFLNITASPLILLNYGQHIMG